MSREKYGVHKVIGADGDVCLSAGTSLDPFSTFCGDCDRVGHTYRATNDQLTCNKCKNAFNTLRHGIKILTTKEGEEI